MRAFTLSLQVVFPSLSPLITDTMTANAGCVVEGFLKRPMSLPTPKHNIMIMYHPLSLTPLSSEAYTAHVGGIGPRDPQVYFSRITAETAFATELSVQDNLKVNNLMSFIIFRTPLPNLVLMSTACAGPM